MKFIPLAKTLRFILALFIFGGGAYGADKAGRDWKKHPAVVEVDTKQTVFAIGDAHGDPGRMAGVLAAAKLTASAATAPDKVKWTAGKAVLVIPGDMIDKGPDSMGVIALLRALQKDAARQGGQVIITMGNHEAEFLAEPDGKKTKEFQDELKKAGLDPAKVAKGGGDLGEFLCGLPIAVRVNDWFFSHGGNSGNRTIAKLEADIEKGFAANGFATQQLVGDNSILEARLNKKGPGGMAWFYEGSAKTDPKKVLASYAGKLGVHHLVQGHQYGDVKFPDGKDRKEETLFQRYGLLFLIDSGMSHGIEGSKSHGGALRIKGPAGQQEAVFICADGKKTTVWDSKHLQDFGDQRCDK
jgi:hypothetical protein